MHFIEICIKLYVSINIIMMPSGHGHYTMVYIFYWILTILLFTSDFNQIRINSVYYSRSRCLQRFNRIRYRYRCSSIDIHCLPNSLFAQEMQMIWKTTIQNVKNNFKKLILHSNCNLDKTLIKCSFIFYYHFALNRPYLFLILARRVFKFFYLV